VFWIAAGVFAYRVPTAKPRCAPVVTGMAQPAVAPSSPGATQVTETIKSDGTKITEKVTINPDGSKTVETTTSTTTPPV